MSGMLPLILLIVASLLALTLVVMALRRINKEGLTVSAPEQKHFVRSVEDVKRRHEQEQIAAQFTEEGPAADEINYTRHGFGKSVSLEFDKAVEQVQAALKQEGLQIKEDLDINRLLKREGEPACHVISFYNAKLASNAIATDPSIGLLLFSAVVRKDYSDAVHVEVSDPVKVVGEAKLSGLEQQAVEIKAALTRILTSLA